MGIDTKLYGVLRDKAQSAKAQRQEDRQEAETLWEQFTKSHEVPYTLMDDVRALFTMTAINDQLYQDLNSREFSKYTNQPETWQLIRSVGREWIDQIVEFIKQSK